MIDLLWSMPIVHVIGMGTWIMGIGIAIYSRIA